ncbi:MAG TPA: efflux RND transporter periplasmic adaptor subunit [Verrucomicrobiae bacterium]|jgi:multidrug efflux pump subunit AcrA (membrane-fusion protein)|nr:efflux RND transporter periplasmic adaptor subunit [Verrucomicrobiae bacterium]
MKIKSSFGTLKCFRHAAMAAGIAVVFGFGSGCAKEEKEKEPEVSVQTTPAEKEDISQIVNAEAVIFPLQQATVSPKITSTIKQFLVQRASKVRKGQLLAVLENADLSAAAESSRGDFEQAEAAYTTTVTSSLPQQIQKAQLDADSAKSAYEAADKVYNSRKDLFQQGALPRRELDAAEVALVAARSQNEQAQKQLADLQRVGKEQALKSAQAQRLSAEGKYRGAAAQLSYSEIKSPIDGVVTDRPLNVGDLAMANQPLLTVMNISRLIAKGHIPQSEAAQLRVGNPAQLKVPGMDDPIEGKVTLVSPALDPGSTTIEVWVEAKKANPNLRPGITVQVAMVAKTVKEAVVVPAAAVYKNPEGNGNYVLVAGTDDKAHVKPVQVGIRNGEDAQIASGINAGDPVITSGGYAVPDGTKIKVEKPEAPEKAEGDKAGADKTDADDPDDKDKKDSGDKKDVKKGGAAAKPEKEKE